MICNELECAVRQLKANRVLQQVVRQGGAVVHSEEERQRLWAAAHSALGPITDEDIAEWKAFTGRDTANPSVIPWGQTKGVSE